MSSQGSFIIKKKKSYWSVSEIDDANDDDGQVGVWKTPLPLGTVELKGGS